MFDFHLHLARLPQPTLLARALLKRGLSFNAIACEPWEWEILQKMEAPLFEGSTRSYGIHPTVAGDVTEADWERLESLLDNYPDANVGECGLDKRYDGYAEGGLQEQEVRAPIPRYLLRHQRELGHPDPLHHLRAVDHRLPHPQHLLLQYPSRPDELRHPLA